MATLLMRLQGPLQSWGTSSRFDERDTQLEPSKSGVLGMLCAALGRDRTEDVSDLAALRMGVRVDREGYLLRDYQTATGVVAASNGKPDLTRTVVSPRYYLSDAVFLVGLEGDEALLSSAHRALANPVWPLALGRKSFVPSQPVFLPDGLVSVSLEEALVTTPFLVPVDVCGQKKHSAPDVNITSGDEQPSGETSVHAGTASDEPGLHGVVKVRVAMEHPSEGSVRLDQPVAPFSERRFGPRFVKQEMIEVRGTHVPE